MAEQRYRAVLAVIADGGRSRSVGGQQWGCPGRRCMPGWPGMRPTGLEGLADRSHRPLSCPHQMPARWRRRCWSCGGSIRAWGPRRIVVELAQARDRCRCRSESAVYRALIRAGVIEPGCAPASAGVVEAVGARRRRWSCGRWTWSAGSRLADGTTAKALTGVDDHSRFCVSARLMPRERTRAVCDGLAAAMRRHGVPAADPHRQRQGVHRPVRPSAGRGALRPDLPGERHRAPADRARGRRPPRARSNGSTAACGPSS